MNFYWHTNPHPVARSYALGAAYAARSCVLLAFECRCRVVSMPNAAGDRLLAVVAHWPDAAECADACGMSE